MCKARLINVLSEFSPVYLTCPYNKLEQIPVTRTFLVAIRRRKILSVSGHLKEAPIVVLLLEPEFAKFCKRNSETSTIKKKV